MVSTNADMIHPRNIRDFSVQMVTDAQSLNIEIIFSMTFHLEETRHLRKS